MGKIAKLLIIAGSDSGGGAGIQADVKAASARGVYACTALTAVTAQNTLGVQAVHLLDPEMVSRQIASVLDDIAVDAVKIGMLGSAGIVQATVEALAGYEGPLVLDPVAVAKSGDVLLDAPAMTALRARLLPRATLLTPNLPEAAQLLGTTPAQNGTEAAAQGAALLDLGAQAVLMKGGHGRREVCTDLLVTSAGAQEFTAPRLHTRNTHGTGCSMASAIAAELAKGVDLPEAVGNAHQWLQGAIAAADALGVGRGHGPVHHFHALWP